jgi:hypothetical protein
MSTKEFDKSLLALIRKQPFQPFEIELVDGERLAVDRADAVACNGGSGAFIAADGSIHFFDSRTVKRLGGRNGASRPAASGDAE